MMLFKSNEWKVREAERSDLEKIQSLIQKKTFVHRHLGWGSPLDLLGSQPFLVLYQDGEILAALACPPDEDSITWLQLFAAAPGMPLKRCWDILWPQAESMLERNGTVSGVNSLVIRDEMDQLLSRAGFITIDQVVVLVWEPERAVWPAQRSENVIRRMVEDDLTEVYRVDRLAFREIWRNSLSQLQAAFQEAFFPTVILVEDQIKGYQISTVNPLGGHLARLAVDPACQSQGLGALLLSDTLARFLEHGIVEVSVNTQYKNQASLELYKKFGFHLLDVRYPVRQFSYSDHS